MEEKIIISQNRRVLKTLACALLSIGMISWGVWVEQNDLLKLLYPGLNIPKDDLRIAYWLFTSILCFSFGHQFYLMQIQRLILDPKEPFLSIQELIKGSYCTHQIDYRDFTQLKAEIRLQSEKIGNETSPAQEKLSFYLLHKSGARIYLIVPSKPRLTHIEKIKRWSSLIPLILQYDFKSSKKCELYESALSERDTPNLDALSQAYSPPKISPQARVILKRSESLNASTNQPILIFHWPRFREVFGSMTASSILAFMAYIFTRIGFVEDQWGLKTIGLGLGCFSLLLVFRSLGYLFRFHQLVLAPQKLSYDAQAAKKSLPSPKRSKSMRSADISSLEGALLGSTSLTKEFKLYTSLGESRAKHKSWFSLPNFNIYRAIFQFKLFRSDLKNTAEDLQNWLNQSIQPEKYSLGINTEYLNTAERMEVLEALRQMQLLD